MGIFFKDNKKDTKKVDVVDNSKKPSRIVSITPVDLTNPSGSALPVGTDYNKHLTEILAKNNQSGNDYLEFAGALKALEGQPISEEQKFTFTYPTYSAAGMTAVKLIESAKAYIRVLDQEKKDFDREMEGTRQVAISDRQALIQSNQKEIEQLTKQIQEKTIKVNRLNEEITSATISLNNEEGAFNSAYANQSAIINDHISKFQKYLMYDKSTQ